MGDIGFCGSIMQKIRTSPDSGAFRAAVERGQLCLGASGWAAALHAQAADGRSAQGCQSDSERQALSKHTSTQHIENIFVLNYNGGGE